MDSVGTHADALHRARVPMPANAHAPHSDVWPVSSRNWATSLLPLPKALHIDAAQLV